MSRVARIVVPGFPHHVTQRGNRRAAVFEGDADYEAYLRFLKQYAGKRGLAIWAYCLMTNHIHLVAVPQREESLGQAVRDMHTVYAGRHSGQTTDYLTSDTCSASLRGMSRVARIVVPGFAHHVTQRGNRRAAVFEGDADYEAYLRFLQQYAGKRGLAIWAYCLMTNHIHLVAVPQREESLGQAVRDVHTVYAVYFNSRTQLSGHVWQGRFFSSPLDETYLWAAVRYVERNPVRAGLAERAEAYRWSSAPAHCGLRTDPVLSADFPPPGVVTDWSAWLHDGSDPDETREYLRRNTHAGRPCGSSNFLDHLEHLLQRSVRPKKGGRPRKENN